MPSTVLGIGDPVIKFPPLISILLWDMQGIKQLHLCVYLSTKYDMAFEKKSVGSND